MKAKLKTIVYVVLLTFLNISQAAVIFSECPVKPSEQTASNETVDKFRPSDSRLWLRSYSKDVANLVKYLSWMYDDRMSKAEKEQELRDIGSMAEDVELTMALSDSKTVCHGEREVTTDPFAIFPFILRTKDANGNFQYRVRYKYCEYYVDKNRQLPIDNACTVVGRQDGYTFAELSARFRLLEHHLDRAHQGVKIFTMLGGVVGSLTAFKFVRVLRLGAIAGISLAAVPTGAAYLAITNGWTEELVRDMVNFQDAAEVAVTGDLSTTVKIAHPIQEFLPYFMRYLDTIDAQKISDRD